MSAFSAPNRFFNILLVVALFCGVLTAPAFAQKQSKAWVEAASKPSPVAGQKRLALILGNANYGGDNSLKNPENDAKDIAVALGELGFASTVVLDGSLQQMSNAVHAFADKIRAAGSQSVALIYYSGHGIQVNGENYLVPVGFIMPASERDINRYALSAESALSEMQEANAQVNIAILDACRNNPFAKSRDLGKRGLAKLEATGVFIAYSTTAGTTADDNIGGKNGLYTASLLTYLRQPGLTLTGVFAKTRNVVAKASNRKQVPFVTDGLIDAEDFCLLPGVAAPASVVESANASTMDTNAHLTITTNVPGATILVDDKPVISGTFTLDLGLAKQKTVEVGIAADGYKSAVQTVTLLRGKTLTLPVTLAALSPTPTPPVGVEVIGTNVPKRFTPPLTLAQYKAQMVMVPAGEFIMGSDIGQEDEKPVHRVYLSAYKIGKTAVTVGMWQEFCTATKGAMPEEPRFNKGWTRRNHPIVNVSWNDAQEYCTWAKLKLPSEAQWEKAARGADGQGFPWGNEFDPKRLWCSTAEADDAGGTRVVGDFPAGASPYGCLDMAGNVFQWCADTYDKGFYGSRRATENDPLNESGREYRVLRGGSWYNYHSIDFRSAIRNSDAPTVGNLYLGIRLSSELP